MCGSGEVDGFGLIGPGLRSAFGFREADMAGGGAFCEFRGGFKSGKTEESGREKECGWFVVLYLWCAIHENEFS
jgi:hypothetical protein